ncbi:MAG TPA: hypothetical protein VN257_07025, partial [Actinotalea sp.]|nr:hypothetical protein [Actinotalea sp.]
MSEPENFTAQQAADPSTPGQVLADIAALRPDLRPVVAANPAAYPGLLEWLGSLGEPGVDAALAARSALEQPTVVLPTAPPVAEPQWQGQAPPVTGEPPVGYGATAAPYGAPTAPYGAPAGPYGAPAPGYQPPAGYPPQGGQPYGYAGTPPKKSGNKALIIILSILGVLLLLGVGAFFAIRGLVNNVVDQIEDDVPGLTEGGYGDDPELDALWDACAAEDWTACDDLYYQAAIGSEYEAFGATCGERTEDAGGSCAVQFGTEDTGGTAVDEPNAYGDDPELDALWDACAAGDLQACDDLYAQSP